MSCRRSLVSFPQLVVIVVCYCCCCCRYCYMWRILIRRDQFGGRLSAAHKPIWGSMDNELPLLTCPYCCLLFFLLYSSSFSQSSSSSTSSSSSSPCLFFAWLPKITRSFRSTLTTQFDRQQHFSASDISRRFLCLISATAVCCARARARCPLIFLRCAAARSLAHSALICAPNQFSASAHISQIQL